MEFKEKITKDLFELGLNSNQATIYVHLLTSGAQTIVEITRDIGIPRTSVYAAVEILLRKGFLEQIILYKSQKLQAAPLSTIQSYIDKRIEKISQVKGNLNELEKNIIIAKTINTKTNVKFYHGKQGFMQMLWNSLSAEKEIVGYSELGRKKIVGQKFMVKWYEKMIENQLKDRVIINPRKDILKFIFTPPENTLRNQYQETRTIPNRILPVTGDTTIYDNTVAICYWQKGEIVGVEIENEEFAKQQRAIFKILWKIAKPL